MEILYKDKYTVVCQKDSGELSEGEGTACLPTLISKTLLADGEKDTAVYPVQRLDRETCGLIVYARTADSAARLSIDIRDGKFSKEYLAVIYGEPSKKSDTLNDLLFYDRRRGKSFAVGRKRAGVKEAVLFYTLLDNANGLSLLNIRLYTGRTHQIRVQLSSRGFPIYGDRRYGSPKSDIKGIALISHKLAFSHPQTGEAMTFTAKIPNCAPWSFFALKTQI